MLMMVRWLAIVVVVGTVSGVRAEQASTWVGRSVMLRTASAQLQELAGTAAPEPGELIEVADVRGELLRIDHGWIHRDDVVAAEDAIEHFSEQLRDERTVFALTSRCQAYAAKGEYQRAIGDCAEILELAPQSASARGNRAWLYLQVGEYRDARRDASAAIKLDPGHAANFSIRGLAYLELGKTDDAIADFNQAIRLNPQSASAYNSRGTAHAERGDHRRAIADISRSIELDPAPRRTAYNPYYNRGRSLAELGRHQDAIADFTKAIEFDGEHSPAYLSRAECWDAIGEEKRSTADYIRAAELDDQAPLPRS
ncbi:MAG: tetratricopeptide repeat protein [Planctomycetes bacterium]|nr:tetratricopeptide repeat protein [Planctomycetota bacterium]